MPTRPCLTCGALSNSSRCPTHRKQVNQRKDAHRGNTAQRGYNAEWRRLVAQAMAAQRAAYGEAFCIDCGITEEQAKTAENPLSGDHIISKARGGRNEISNIAIRCRWHNSSKGIR